MRESRVTHKLGTLALLRRDRVAGLLHSRFAVAGPPSYVDGLIPHSIVITFIVMIQASS